MLLGTYYSQNYACIIYQGLLLKPSTVIGSVGNLSSGILPYLFSLVLL